MASSPDSFDDHHGFQIAPLVDVVFVLMLFFMVNAGIQKRDMHLDTQVPHPSHEPGILPITVEITRDGSVSANGLMLVTPEDQRMQKLQGWLANIAEQDSVNDPMIIRANGDVRHERLMKVLETIKQVGFAKVSLQ